MKRKLYIRPTTDIVPILHCRLLDEWSANNGNGDGNGGTVDEDDELSAARPFGSTRRMGRTQTCSSLLTCGSKL